MLIIDAHEDLAWNTLTFGRDYRRSSAATRSLEEGTKTPTVNDDSMLGWPDYQIGQIGLVFATLFASPVRHCAGPWDKLCYESYDQARQLYCEQLDFYERLADTDSEKFRLIQSQRELSDLLRVWENPPVIEAETGEIIKGNPVGLVILMEGAEGVRDPGELDEWWERGVRIIGPSWVGTKFAGGTKEPGPLTSQGRSLLEKMSEIGFGLDLSHMDDKAVLQALDLYEKPLMASHSNAQALLKGDESNRHLSDQAIRGIIERDGVIGVHFYNAFLKPGWKRGDSREEVPLDRLIAQIDYICQIAGDAMHVGFGTDFDGGLGLQCAPVGIDSIADLQKVIPHLIEKGYSQEDCAAILANNWLSILRKILP